MDRVEAAAEEGQRRHHQQRHQLQLLEVVRPDADDEAEQAEGHRGEQQERQHPQRMLDLERHEQPRGDQDDQAQDDRLARRRAHVAGDDLEWRHRRRQDLVDRAHELREVDAERRVGDALRQQRQHDQSRHDEGAVADPIDPFHVRTDRRTEHHEVQRGGNHRRNDALQQGAPGARHLEQIDCTDRVNVHVRSLTRLTKMSSSELWLVLRSLKSMPASPSRRSSMSMPVCSPCASKV